MKVPSLRFKLGWNNGIIISLVLLCIGIARYHTVSFRSQRSFDQDLRDDAHLFAAHFRLTSTGFDWSNRDLGVGDILTLEAFRPYFVVTDGQGRILHRELLGRHMEEMLVRNNLAPILRQSTGLAQADAPDGTTFRFVSLRLPSDGGDDVILHLGRPMDAVQRVLEEYFFTYVSSVPLVLTISVVVCWLLAGRALRPFEEVAQTAKEITSENLNTQIATPRQEEEIQSLVQSFNAMVSRLDGSFRQMRKFNADVAHELRTPLAIMQGENEIALRQPSLPEEVRAVLASNLEELERLTRIVNDLLTLSEAEAGNQVIVRKPINLRVLIEDLVEQIRLLATDRNITIELAEIADATIDGDELWIRRALLNLLDNAIKYSRDGGRVIVSAQIRDEVVRLQIHDEGIGIAAADIPHIFDRLYRADKARNRASGGTGLGLALVKWVVEAHEGRIQVTSEPERGASFEVAFPVRAA